MGAHEHARESPRDISSSQFVWSRRSFVKAAVGCGASSLLIFVPPGDESDPTRAPAFYDDTYEYLTGLGVAEV